MGRRQTAAGCERTLRQARAFIDRNMGDRDLSLEVVAAEVYVSTRQLQRAFRASGGTTFSAYLTTCRMERAVALLREGRSAREVAEWVGYGSGSALAKALRRHSGEGPAAFRPPD